LVELVLGNKTADQHPWVLRVLLLATVILLVYVPFLVKVVEPPTAPLAVQVALLQYRVVDIRAVVVEMVGGADVLLI
jgi:hypothetical protein